MDRTILHQLNELAVHHDALEDPLAAYVRASELLFLAGVLVLLLAGRWSISCRRAAVAGGLGAAIALALAGAIAHIVNRPRPFVADPSGVDLLVRHAADPGFPSDHATAAFAIATAVLLYRRRWGVVALVAATVLAIGRVALGVHYPSDVLAGALLGIATALLLHTSRPRAAIERLTDAAGRRIERLLQSRRRPAPSAPS